MNEEQKMLQTWVAIKEECGLSKAKKTNKILLFLGVVLSIVVTYIFYYKINPLFSILPSILIGWSIAERNALRARIESWPKLEKYLNWKLIQENNKN